MYVSGYVNIVTGILFVIGGLSRRIALFSTNGPDALAAVGLIPIAMECTSFTTITSHVPVAESIARYDFRSTASGKL
jgi:hypothetical protein